MAKEDDFKERFVAVVKDLHANGGEDPEAMFLIGSLAARLMDRAKQPSWAAYKASMTGPAYDKLLRDFQQQGNDFHKEGKKKHAYAIQVLAMSLVARTQKTPEVRQGEGLLDNMLGIMIATYRKSATATSKLN